MFALNYSIRQKRYKPLAGAGVKSVIWSSKFVTRWRCYRDVQTFLEGSMLWRRRHSHWQHTFNSMIQRWWLIQVFGQILNRFKTGVFEWNFLPTLLEGLDFTTSYRFKLSGPFVAVLYFFSSQKIPTMRWSSVPTVLYSILHHCIWPKYVLSTMGVSKESIIKFLIGNRFHVKLRILSPYSNRIRTEDA